MANAINPTEKHAWERWLPMWHAMFYILLVVVTPMALLDGRDVPLRILIIPFAIGLGLWYGVSIWQPPSCWNGKLAWQAAYFTAGWSIWFTLAAIHPAFMTMLFVMFAHIYMYVWFPWSFLGAGVLMALVIIRQSIEDGKIDAESLFISGVSTIVGGMLAVFIHAIVRQSSERQSLIDELTRTRRELAAAEREAGVLQERQRLAREIHDTLAQSFTSIVMNIEAAESALPNENSTAHQHLGQAKQMARNSLQEARRWVWELRPEILEQKRFDEGIRSVITEWSVSNRTPAELTITGSPSLLSPQHEVALLRVVQESLSNIRKHANAKSVNITLSYMGDSVSLDILDDGQGFDPTSVERDHISKNGFGLIGMRERVEQAGGTFLVESSKSDGTTIVITLPLENTLPNPHRVSATSHNGGLN